MGRMEQLVTCQNMRVKARAPWPDMVTCKGIYRLVRLSARLARSRRSWRSEVEGGYTETSTGVDEVLFANTVQVVLTCRAGLRGTTAGIPMSAKERQCGRLRNAPEQCCLHEATWTTAIPASSVTNTVQQCVDHRQWALVLVRDTRG
jgi:hypothetical protein